MKARMHAFMIVAVSILFSIFIAGSSFAAGEGKMGGTGYEKGAMKGKTGSSDSFFRVSNWIDKSVMSNDGKELGEVHDIVFGHDGRAEYVVLSHEDKLIPVPFKAGDFRMEGDNIVAGLEQSKLQNAPSFTEDNWPDFASSGYEREVHGYYGVTGGSKGMSEGEGMRTAPGGMKEKPGMGTSK